MAPLTLCLKAVERYSALEAAGRRLEAPEGTLLRFAVPALEKPAKLAGDVGPLVSQIPKPVPICGIPLSLASHEVVFIYTGLLRQLRLCP
jgi:hypothetical protein